MRSIQTLLTVMLAALALPVAADNWHLAPPCPADNQARHAEFERQVRAAEPDSPMYIPHPFPKNDAQVFEDLIYGLRRGVGSPVPKPDQPFFNAVDHDRATYRVRRVATWTPLYCGRREKREFVYVVQVFEDDREISRGTVAPSGHFGMLMHWASSLFPENPPPIPADPAALVRSRVEDLPRNAHQFQYVTVWGSIRCDELIPCVAFRAGAEVYLWWREPATDREGLFRIAEDKGRQSMEQRMGDARSRDQFLRSFQGTPDEIVTLGADDLAIVVPVEARVPEPLEGKPPLD